MNSLERVKAALQFKNPDRIPTFNLISGDIYPLLIGHSVNWKPGWNEGEEGLFPHISFNFNWDRPEWARSNPDYEGNKWKAIPHEEIDEWGCIWNMRGNDDNMGHPGRPSLPDWNDYPNYISKYTPNADDDSRYSIAKNMKEKLEEEKYLMLIIPTFGPSQVVSEMRGFHNYLIDHQKHPKELVRALELVAGYHIDLIKNSIKRGLNPHGIWLVDDLGEQTGPFFSPRTFRKYYESSYKWIIDDAHEMGIDVHLHCCGKIDRLLPVLIEWGLDSIELDSPRMSGYNDLMPFRGKIMFWGCVNIQSIYPNGTPEQVEREVWHMMRNLGTKDGGFGAYFYPQSRDIRAPRRNIKAFERGLKKYGNYAEVPPHWWDYPIEESWIDDVVPPLPPLEP